MHVITQKDWYKIREFAKTKAPITFVGPWGWETEYAEPNASDLLEFIEKEIGIKEHTKPSEIEGARKSIWCNL